MPALFVDSQNHEYGQEDFYNVLKDTGSADCDTLFIHSDLSFGKIAENIKRDDLLSALYEVLIQLGVKNIIVPAFTYSFCNNETFDVNKSRTYMGALNEYIRKKDGRYRTLDPLLSVSVPNSLKNKFDKVSSHSLGEGSGLDLIHKMENVNFLFLGARLGNCFTYVHYVEKMLDVKYRFDMPFNGQIIDHEGKCTEKTQYIHTACYGVKPAEFYYFEDELEDRNLLKKIKLGDSFISSIKESDAFREISSKIKNNINYFLEEPFTSDDLIHIYKQGLDGHRITHC